MSRTTQNVKITITDISGIDMKSLNVYNMQLCSDNFDAANKQYVDIKSAGNFLNIGSSSTFYRNDVTISLFRDITTNILTSLSTVTNLFLNGNMFYCPYPFNSSDTTTITVNQRGYICGTLGQNGKIYFPPGDSTQILILNPFDNSTDTTSIPISTGNTSLKWMSSLLSPNGKIYCIPGSGTSVLIIDPMTNVADTTSINLSGIVNSSIKWSCSCMTPNGLLYGIPYAETRVLIVNTKQNTFDITSLSVNLSSNAKFSSCVYTPQNKIFGFPGSTGVGNVLLIDLNTNTTNTSSITIGGGQAYASAVLAPNGLIYAPPSVVPNIGNREIALLNPNTNVVDTSSLVFETGLNFNTFRYYGALCSPDGLLYFTPGARNFVLTLNTGNNSFNTSNVIYSAISPTVLYGKSILATNGKIYCSPYNTTNILIVNSGTAKTNFRLCIAVNSN